MEVLLQQRKLNKNQLTLPKNSTNPQEHPRRAYPNHLSRVHKHHQREMRLILITATYVIAKVSPNSSTCARRS